MALVKIKKIILLGVISLIIGFLSGCDVKVPAFLSKPDVYEVYSILDDYYYKDLAFELDDVDSVDQIIELLDDPYTYIYEPDTRTIELDEAYIGIGITISDIETGILVTDINLDANLTGLIYPGDIITAVNDTLLEPLSFLDKQATLKGDLNDQLNLTVLRGDQTINTLITIKEIPLNSVTFKRFENGIGYIDINRFSLATIDLFSAALTSLETQTITGLIIDVRNNGGGYLTAVVNILRHFMTGEDAFVTMHRVYDDNYTYYYPNDDAVKKPYPITVLVDENSASASEVLAISMRENGSYPLIGQKTFGKHVYQISVNLRQQEKDMMLNLTEGYWLSPLGNSVEGGIAPDVISLPHPLFTLDYPIYDKTLSLEDDLTAHQALISLINIYENDLEDVETTIFNLALKEKVEAFQTNEALEVTGTLNYETILTLIDYYILLQQTETFDDQLKDAIDYLVAL